MNELMLRFCPCLVCYQGSCCGSDAFTLEFRDYTPSGFPHLLPLPINLPIADGANTLVAKHNDIHMSCVRRFQLAVALVTFFELFRRFGSAEIDSHCRVAH